MLKFVEQRLLLFQEHKNFGDNSHYFQALSIALLKFLSKTKYLQKMGTTFCKYKNEYLLSIRFVNILCLRERFC